MNKFEVGSRIGLGVSALITGGVTNAERPDVNQEALNALSSENAIVQTYEQEQVEQSPLPTMVPTPERMSQDDPTLVVPSFSFPIGEGLHDIVAEMAEENGGFLTVAQTEELLGSTYGPEFSNQVSLTHDLLSDDQKIESRVFLTKVDGEIYGSVQHLTQDGSQYAAARVEGNEAFDSHLYTRRNENESMGTIAVRTENGVHMVPARYINIEGDDYLESYLTFTPEGEIVESPAYTFHPRQNVNIRDAQGEDVGDAIPGEQYPALQYQEAHVPGLPDNMTPIPQSDGSFLYIASAYGETIPNVRDAGERVTSPEDLLQEPQIIRNEDSYTYIDEQGVEHEVQMQPYIQGNFDRNKSYPVRINRPELGVYEVYDNRPGLPRHLVNGLYQGSEVEDLGEYEAVRYDFLVLDENGKTTTISPYSAPLVEHPYMHTGISVGTASSSAMHLLDKDSFIEAAEEYIGHNVPVGIRNPYEDSQLVNAYYENCEVCVEGELEILRTFMDDVREGKISWIGSVYHGQLNIKTRP